MANIQQALITKMLNRWSIRQNIIDFAEKQLQDHQPRDDYRELLELSIIFQGGIPPRGAHLMKPTPVHHARWMAKMIYSFKVWMFRGQFNLTCYEEKGIWEFCLFVVIIYLKAWFTAPIAACAPHFDLQLLKDLKAYKDTHAGVSKATSAKLL